mmetsp:Transcript_7678/g.17731  ORF Transcript_7678/g.17731 Transcript_7678/m.17731 type:complete len:273 (-) Transcript_7678:314-1132(-)
MIIALKNARKHQAQHNRQRIAPHAHASSPPTGCQQEDHADCQQGRVKKSPPRLQNLKKWRTEGNLYDRATRSPLHQTVSPRFGILSPIPLLSPHHLLMSPHGVLSPHHLGRVLSPHHNVLSPHHRVVSPHHWVRAPHHRGSPRARAPPLRHWASEASLNHPRQPHCTRPPLGAAQGAPQAHSGRQRVGHELKGARTCDLGVLSGISSTISGVEDLLVNEAKLCRDGMGTVGEALVSEMEEMEHFLSAEAESCSNSISTGFQGIQARCKKALF